MQLYRKTRRRVQGLLDEVRAAGFEVVRIDAGDQGPADIADICRLTCLEQGIQWIDFDGKEPDGSVPRLEIRGMKVFLSVNERPIEELKHGSE